MFLYFLWENQETRNKSLKYKRQLLINQFPELEKISIKPISYFYKNKANLSYKRISVREPKKGVNIKALA